MCVMTFGAICSPGCVQYVENFHANKYAQNPEIKYENISR